MKFIKFILFGAVIALILPVAQADDDSRGPRVLTLNCDGRHTIARALRHVRSGDTVLVSGTCNENVHIPKELSRITLDGQGTASIVGPDATAPTVGIHGSDITIKGFNVSGGLVGIDVDIGGSATADGNVIHHSTSVGIRVSMSSTASIVNNTIQNNADDGIRIGESSSARIGFREGRGNRTAEPNIIQDNGGRGIRVTRSSSARIFGNTIRNNGHNGVDIQRAAYADISSNTIDGNARDGILVNQNSAVVLGADAIEDPLADAPNNTTVNNGGVGLRCGTNSSADGRRGTLNGNAGPQNFDSTCVNSTIP